MYRFISRIFGAITLALMTSLSVAQDLPIIDQSERDQYWIEKKPLNFSWRALNMRLMPMDSLPSGTCFNASFIIDNVGAVQSVKVLKIFPEKYKNLISSLEKPRIWSKYRFTPSPQNSAKQPIQTNYLYYKKGSNPSHAHYISDIETACALSLKFALSAQGADASVDLAAIKAIGKQALKDHYSSYRCDKEQIDCACAHEKFEAKWNALGMAASIQNADIPAIDNACRIKTSDDEIIAKIKAEAAKMRTNVCEKSPAMKGYDCGCYEQLEVEKNIEISKIIPYGVQTASRMSSENAKALKNINRTYNQRLTQECTVSAGSLSQAEIEKESQEVLLKCEASAELSSSFECGCLAERFGEERKKHGRDLDQTHIISKVGNSLGTTKACINVEKKTEYVEKGCLKGKIFFDMKGVSMQEYCGCVSENFSERLTAHTGSFNSSTEARIKDQASTQCRKTLIQ